MKQIEEMGKLCPFREEDKCNLLEDEGVCDFDCDMCNYADALYNAGYRKQSEVARQIFEEMEGLMLFGTIGNKYPAMIIHPDNFTKLKNKYTEVEK